MSKSSTPETDALRKKLKSGQRVSPQQLEEALLLSSKYETAYHDANDKRLTALSCLRELTKLIKQISRVRP